MNSENKNFEIKFLDHVAIRVNDLQISSNWYEKVLGLKKHQPREWGTFPVFMLAGKSGVALFPEKKETNSARACIDHFAFNVSNENFEKAKKRYAQLELKYEIQDHHFFHSLYTKDPDGHLVELTTLVVDETLFYESGA